MTLQVRNYVNPQVTTTTYQYDDLNRLTQADLENAGTNPNYNIKNWTYNWLGNIVSSPDKGFYTYAGNTGGSFANPDAVTSNASSSYSYDNNGNLLTGDNFTNTWDYRNRLTQSQLNGTTTSYLYDVNDERIALGANGATTTYPFKLYNVQGNTIYKHIFANGEPVADIKGSTSTAAVYYIHDDHLGGSSVISDANANVAQVLEYYPFGGTRLDQRPDNTFNEQRRSDGHEFDAGTGLLYQDARYLGPTLGRFLSEDPAFLDLGVDQNTRQLLDDPQLQNAYSYTRNNPIIKRDPDGKFVEDLCVVECGLLLAGAGLGIFETYATNPNATPAQYAVGAAGGSVQLAYAGESIIGNGAVAFLTSLTQDKAGGEPLNFPKATINGLTNAIGISYFRR
jgi:RHS repeat-associated protein